MLIKKHTPLLSSLHCGRNFLDAAMNLTFAKDYSTYKKKLLDRNIYKSSKIVLKDRFESEQIYLMKPLVEPPSFRDLFFIITQLEQTRFLVQVKNEDDRVSLQFV